MATGSGAEHGDRVCLQYAKGWIGERQDSTWGLSSTCMSEYYDPVIVERDVTTATG